MKYAVGDYVRINGKTVYEGAERELIPIGTIVLINDVIEGDSFPNCYGVIDKDDNEYYYPENKLESIEENTLALIKDAANAARNDLINSMFQELYKGRQTDESMDNAFLNVITIDRYLNKLQREINNAE